MKTVNDRAGTRTLTLSIAAVERDTGLSKDSLRVWERRYGFPAPQRDGLGERAYPLDQVDKLRVLKRLLDAGHRPGRLVPLPLAELQLLAERTVGQPQRAAEAAEMAEIAELAVGGEAQRAMLALIRSHDLPALRAALTRSLVRFGLGRFVTEVVAPLTTAVGDAWMRGQMEIFEEHLFTEALQGVLRQAIGALPAAPAAARPAVLLSTFPGEPHGLGLLMAEALMALDGCRCVSLGPQTPPWDIVLAAQACHADVVALSFTGCMNPNQVVAGLAELRGKLPADVQLWVGGSAPVLHRRGLTGVQAFQRLEELPRALQRWRQAALMAPRV